MWQYDFHLFYMGARAVLEGTSPYAMWDFNGPYPLALFFVPFALLPEPLAYVAFLLVNLGLIWKILGIRRSVWALLSFPILFCLFVGQVDLLLTMLALVGSPWLLGLTIIKPQVGFILLPWMLRHLQPVGYAKAALTALLLIAVSFLLRPTWFSEWRAGSPGLLPYSGHASNIYWLIPDSWTNIILAATLVGSILVLPIGFLLKERANSWTVVQLFAPLSNIYSPSVLFEYIGPIEALISWLAILLVRGDIHHGAPLFLMSFSILLRTNRTILPWRNKKIGGLL